MELHELDMVIVLCTHDGVRKPLCRKSFTNARCALQNDVLLTHQHSIQLIIFGLGDKYLFQEILLGILRCICVFVRHFLAIHNF